MLVGSLAAGGLLVVVGAVVLCIGLILGRMKDPDASDNTGVASKDTQLSDKKREAPNNTGPGTEKQPTGTEPSQEKQAAGLEPGKPINENQVQVLTKSLPARRCRQGSNPDTPLEGPRVPTSRFPFGPAVVTERHADVLNALLNLFSNLLLNWSPNFLRDHSSLSPVPLSQELKAW